MPIQYLKGMIELTQYHILYSDFYLFILLFLYFFLAANLPNIFLLDATCDGPLPQQQPHSLG